ncbi:hypothetical protein IWQ62_001851 [Dispira parvispora]|uniref:Uncharacterized protein n=1 Tax=Dispira parvispora TaxID=1520584 RepID=A0A9W8AXE1_9FUNG|nr:hypothetical protein IWQ62_001851 [Dispira parvispora]
MKVSTIYAAVLFAALSAVSVSGEPGQHAVAPAEYHAQPAPQSGDVSKNAYNGKHHQPQHVHAEHLPAETPVAIPYQGPEHGGYEVKKFPHVAPAAGKPSSYGGFSHAPKTEIAPQHKGGERNGPQGYERSIYPGGHAGGNDHAKGYNGGVAHGQDRGFKGDNTYGKGYGHVAPSAPEHHNAPQHAPATGPGYGQGQRGDHKGSQGYVSKPHQQQGSEHGVAHNPAHGHNGNGYQSAAAPAHQNAYAGNAPSHTDSKPIQAPQHTPVHGHNGNGYQGAAAPAHQNAYGGNAPSHTDSKPIQAPHHTPAHDHNGNGYQSAAAPAHQNAYAGNAPSHTDSKPIQAPQHTPAHGHNGNAYQGGAAPAHQNVYGGNAPSHTDREPIQAPHHTPVHTPIHTPQH